MLDNAFEKYKDLSSLILHTDQGWQYQIGKYLEKLRERKIKQSMSRKGNCLDNSLIENFFRIMKNEMFYGNEYTFKTLDDLKEAIEKYTEYYNHERISLKLKGLTPVQYRINPFIVYNKISQIIGFTINIR